MKNVLFQDSPVGLLGIAEENGAICRVFFSDGQPLPGYATDETPLLREAAAQLAAYFSGQRTSFDLPLALHGTAFQLSVWNALRAIPAGETRSYREIAELVGNPKACRAVGMANNRNPVAIIVPCHRVVGADGSMTGYAGGLPIKKYLLELEKRRE